MIPSEKQLSRQVSQFLKDRAPRQYRQLQTSGQLEQHCQEMAEQMLEEFDAEMGRAITDLNQLVRQKEFPHQDRVQFLNEAQRRIWETILQTYLESPEETTTELAMAS